MSEVHLDFLFLCREEDSPQTMAVLVVKERTSQMTMSAAAPGKTTGTYIAKRVVGSLREIGGLHGDVVVKSDQEPALRSIVEDVARVNGTDGGRYVVKCSPVGARLSNGMVERAMQSVSGQTSVLLSTMVWGRSIPYDHPWMCHIVGYAGVLQRFEVGRSDDPWHWHRRGGAVVEDHLGS